MGAVRRLKLTPEALRSRAAQVRAISRRLTSRFHGGVARQMPWLVEDPESGIVAIPLHGRSRWVWVRSHVRTGVKPSAYRHPALEAAERIDGSSDFRWGWRLAGGLGAGLTGSRSPRIGGDQAPDCLEDLDGVQRYGAPRCAFH